MHVGGASCGREQRFGAHVRWSESDGCAGETDGTGDNTTHTHMYTHTPPAPQLTSAMYEYLLLGCRIIDAMELRTAFSRHQSLLHAKRNPFLVWR